MRFLHEAKLFSVSSVGSKDTHVNNSGAVEMPQGPPIAGRPGSAAARSHLSENAAVQAGECARKGVPGPDGTGSNVSQCSCATLCEYAEAEAKTAGEFQSWVG